MKKFVRKILLILSLPIFLFILLLTLYVRLDPYKDFDIYENYSWKYSEQSLGDISTKKLLKNKFNSNSYIMGSSRTTRFFACYLQSKIKGSNFFHYGNWNESIGGIYEKIKLIDHHGNGINNIVFLFDTDFTFNENGSAREYDHFLITHQPRVNYLYNHFISFFKNKTNIMVLLNHKSSIEKHPNWESDINTNDVNHNCNRYNFSNYGNQKIEELERNRIDSLLKYSNFFKRDKPGEELKPQISNSEYEILQKIKRILDKYEANYYIIIPPLYDQKKFHKSDIVKIQRVFKKNIYDFSGVNEITKSPYNYPDRNHFRAWIAKSIIDSIRFN